MALLLLLWLHIILNKSSLSIKHAADLRGLTRQNQRLPVRLQHRIKTHISHDGQATSDASRPPAPPDSCPNHYNAE